MKVLVISNYRGFHEARPEAELFIGLAQQGVHIEIMTYGDAEYVPAFREAGIRVIDFHPQKKLSKSEISFIRKYLIENKIDILHLFNNTSIINGLRAAKGLPVKVVLYRGYAGNIHWYDPLSYLTFLNPRVDKIICNSTGVEEYISGQMLFGKRKTVTINKGHKLEWYSGIQPHDIRGELGLPADSFLIANVANNRKFKGVAYLLNAFTQLPPDLPVHLLLIGRNMDTPENLQLIRRGKNAGHIHLLGFRSDALRIVAGCNVFVLASVKGESITKSVIEAMSLGIAPVITSIAGNRELVVNEESGLMVPPRNPEALRDALLRLYYDRAFCSQLAQQAQDHIEHFLNLDRTIAETKSLYESLLK